MFPLEMGDYRMDGNGSIINLSGFLKCWCD